MLEMRAKIAEVNGRIAEAHAKNREANLDQEGRQGIGRTQLSSRSTRRPFASGALSILQFIELAHIS
jgi:hypothetical protein